MATDRPVVVAGVRIGRWTVQDEFIKTAKGEKKWLCRCDCGTERYVLERSLRHGGSMSCGCIRKEEAVKAISYDLAGQVFGDLTVLSKAENQRKNGGIWWTCQCSCGNLYDVPGSLLVTGRRTHCGSKAHPKNYASVDISNQRFHRLVALYPLKNRDPKGAVLWRCKCDCGNEADVSYNNLVYGNMKSCGCQKKEHDRALKGFLIHIDGTSLEMLGSAKLPVNNTTGCRGVYFIKGKYVAKIVFQKKAYYLGTYVNMEDAVQARKDAEEAVFQTALPFYAAWKRKAEGDPDWAAENPVSVRVLRNQENRLYLEMLPSNVG